MPVLYMEKSSIESLTESDIKEIITENMSFGKFTELKNYYMGNHKSPYVRSRKDQTLNNRLVNNMAKYITDTAIGYFVGKPVIYSSNNSEFLKRLQDVFDYNDEQDHNTELAKMNSIYGNAFEMLYIDEEVKIRMARIEPSDLIMIYETGYSSPVAAIRLIHSEDKKGNSILKAEFWNSSEVWYFQSINNGSLEIIDLEEHFWGDIPFVEYINNEERIGDFEGVISLIDAYNKVQSNTANLFEYNDEALLKITKLGDVSTNDIKEMKEKGAVILDDGGDVDWLLKQVDDTSLENYKNRLREDMHIFSNVPNMTDEAFGGNLSGVAVSYKLWGLEQICAIKERKFKKALQRRIELITHILNLQGGNYSYMDIEIQFRRNKPQNILETAQVITMLAADLSRETRLKMLPTIDNVQDELDKLQAEKEDDLAGYGNNYSNLKDFAKAFDTSKNNEEVFLDEHEG